MCVIIMKLVVGGVIAEVTPTAYKHEVSFNRNIDNVTGGLILMGWIYERRDLSTTVKLALAVI